MTCFSDLLDKKIARRRFLQLTALSCTYATSPLVSTALSRTSPTAEIPHSNAHWHEITPDYNVQTLLQWGDPLTANLPPFSPASLNAEEQSQRFGYNNDFLHYFPIDRESDNSLHGILCVNHEYVSPSLMFEDYSHNDASKEQVDIQMNAVGMSIVEIAYNPDSKQWSHNISSPLNRRITAFTECQITGPAAAHPRMQTDEHFAGLLCYGTFSNCAGGATPWRTVLTAEENIDLSFSGNLPKDHPEYTNHAAMDISSTARVPWHQHHERFNVALHPNEPNRHGWICEIDPYSPNTPPKKRTALGRFKHEGALTVQDRSGHIVIYMGDDERFEHIYKFVSKEKYNRYSSTEHFLDEGTLYVAIFHEDSSLQWKALTHGEGPLTSDNGFHDQGDVMIETRRAAKLLGATPMDRPEGIAYNPINKHVYVALTNNNKRKQPHPANPRRDNIHGHIISLSYEEDDHINSAASWDILVLAGNPDHPDDSASYPTAPSKDGWFSSPDNLLCGTNGKLWITTDGQERSIGYNDGLYVMDLSSETPGAPHHIFNAPIGAEVTGPALTPDGRTLFLSIQHPGESSSFSNPSTRWPNNNKELPPFPAVIAIERKDGGVL